MKTRLQPRAPAVPIPIPALPRHFVALRRRFQRLDEADPHYEKSLHWPEVLQHRVAVVLAQHSCGKTTELLALAAGEPGRFLYCELQDLEARLAQFEAEPGRLPEGAFCLLLDSLEEATAGGPGRVVAALLRLGTFIRTRQLDSRLHVVLGCRPDRFGGGETARLGELGLGQPALFELLPLDTADHQVLHQRMALPEPIGRYGVLDYPWQFLQALQHGPEVATWSAAESQRHRIEYLVRADLGAQHISLPELVRTWPALEHLAAAAALSGRTLLRMVPSADPQHLDIRSCLLGWQHDDLVALLGSLVFRPAEDDSYQFAHQSYLEYLAASGLAHALEDGRLDYEKLRPWLYHEDEDGPLLRPRLMEVVLWLAELAHGPARAALVQELEQVEPALLFERRRLAPRQRQHFARVLQGIDRNPPVNRRSSLAGLRYKLPELAGVLSDLELQAEACALVEREQLRDRGLLVVLLEALVAADPTHRRLVAALVRAWKGLHEGPLFQRLLFLLHFSETGRALAAELMLAAPTGRLGEELNLARLLHPKLPHRPWWEAAGQRDYWTPDHLFKGAAPEEIVRVLGYFGGALSAWPDVWTRARTLQDVCFQGELLQAHRIALDAIETLLALPVEQWLAIEPQARPFLAYALLGRRRALIDARLAGAYALQVASYVRHAVGQGVQGATEWQQPGGFRWILSAGTDASSWLDTPAEFAFLRQIVAYAEDRQRREHAKTAARATLAVREANKAQRRLWFTAAPGWMLDLLVHWRLFWKKCFPVTHWQARWTAPMLDRLSHRAAWLFAVGDMDPAWTRIWVQEQHQVLATLLSSAHPGVREAMKQALLAEFAMPWNDEYWPDTNRLLGLLASQPEDGCPMLSCPMLMEALLETLAEAPCLPQRQTALAVVILFRAGAEVPVGTVRQLQARDPTDGALWCLWAWVEPDAALTALARQQPDAGQVLLREVDHVLQQGGFGRHRQALWARIAASDSVQIAFEKTMESGDLLDSAIALLEEIAKSSSLTAARVLRQYRSSGLMSRALVESLRSVRDNIASQPLLLRDLEPLLHAVPPCPTPATGRPDFHLPGVGDYWKLHTSPVGRGGQGTVWKVRDSRHTAYALKVVQLEQDRHVDRERVKREIEALRQSNCRQLPQIYGSALESDRALLLMEWAKGEAVSALAAGQINGALLTSLVAQVALALGDLHGRGCMHRDVKPANIIMNLLDGGRDSFMLVDLGLAVFGEGLRLSRTLVGTEVFMPPHYLAHSLEPDLPFDAGRDLYGLGATAVWLGLRERDRRLEFVQAWERARESRHGAQLLVPFAQALDLSPAHRAMLARMVGPHPGWPSLEDVIAAFPAP